MQDGTRSSTVGLISDCQLYGGILLLICRMLFFLFPLQM